MSKEAMKLALEDYLSREMPEGTVIGDPKWWAGKIANVLAKQEQDEPVAYMYPDDLERMQTSESFCNVFSVKVGSPDKGLSTVELYTTPQPIGFAVMERSWIGLTDEEINQAYADSYKGIPLHESLEAILRKNNT
jgi:hypothetical protein